MENNTVTISEREYETLIRDSEKVRILTQAVLDGVVDPGYWLKVILGVQEIDLEHPDAKKEQPEVAPLRGHPGEGLRRN